MRSSKPLPPVEEIRSLLAYDPTSGSLTWRVDRPNAKAGSEAGSIVRVGGGRVYRQLKLDGRRVYAQAVAWCLATGAWPNHIVGFVDRDPLNYRFANLVAETSASSQHRRTKALPNSTTGLLGVCRRVQNGREEISAKIKVNMRRIHLGMFKTPEEAHAAYLSAKKVMHPQSRRSAVDCAAAFDTSI